VYTLAGEGKHELDTKPARLCGRHQGGVLKCRFCNNDLRLRAARMRRWRKDLYCATTVIYSIGRWPIIVAIAAALPS